jgi:hypothetical protein
MPEKKKKGKKGSVMTAKYSNGAVEIRIPYDPSKQYPINENTKKSRRVASSDGFMEIEGADGLKLNLNAIQSLNHGE